MATPIELEIANLFDKMSEYLLDPTKDFSHVTTDLKYAESLTFSVLSEQRAPSLSAGACSDIAHRCMALIREHTIRMRTRRQYFDFEVDFSKKESDSLKLIKDEFIKYVTGKMPVQ